MDNISIHALCEEGDPENVVISKMPEISIHALCEEGDGAGLLLSTCKQLFLSTPSARRATVLKGPQARRRQDFYPRPLRGGRPPTARHSPGLGTISIHALCEEGDCCCICMANSCCIFLSTPSARRATRLRPWAAFVQKFLSTPSARRATRKI